MHTKHNDYKPEKNRYYSDKPYIGINETNIIPYQQHTSLFERFCQDCQLKEKTKKTYQNAILQFMIWLKKNGIQNPVRSDIIRYLNELHINGKPDGTPYSAATIKAYTNALRYFFSWLEDEHLYENISRRIKAPATDKGHKKLPLTEDQVQTVLSMIDISTDIGRRDYAILCTMVILGLRTIEVSRANIADLKTVGLQHRLYPFGKGRDEVSSEFLIVPESLYELIQNYLYDREACNPSDPLFISYSHNSLGKRITSNSVSRIVKTYFRQAGIDTPEITAHSLRHTAVTLALKTRTQNGDPITIRDVQRFARHMSQDTTEIYAHDLERENSQVENSLSSIILDHKKPSETGQNLFVLTHENPQTGQKDTVGICTPSSLEASLTSLKRRFGYTDKQMHTCIHSELFTLNALCAE